MAIKKRLLSIYIIFSLITLGFNGLYILELDSDNSVVKAAKTIVVDNQGGGNYEKIQDAIDNASSGDTVRVWDGIYFENIVIDKKITLKGNGTKYSIINGGNLSEVILIISDNVNVSGFTITNSGIHDSGIALNRVENCTIENNNISRNNGIGLYVYNSNYTKVRNNIAYSNRWEGISVWYGRNNSIMKNTCKFHNYCGIHIYCSSNNIIENNSLSNNNIGFQIQGCGESCRGSSRASAYPNTRQIRQPREYIPPSFAFSNIVENNSCHDNKYGIIIVDYANYNQLFHNNITKNINGLTLIENKWIDCPDYNLIFRNNFINNSVQMNNATSILNQNNISHNYWSDYSGLDNGANGRKANDGIGDTNIPHLNLDHYPLMNPIIFINLLPKIPKINDLPDFNCNGSYLIQWNSSLRAKGYILQESTNSDFYFPVEIYNGSNLIFNIVGKVNGTYYYRVKAYNQLGASDWSNIIKIIVDLHPNVPINFRATPYQGGNTINLSWSLNFNDTTEYLIYSNSTGNWSELISIEAPEKCFNHTGLIDGQNYYYSIRARDDRGQVSELSEIVMGIPWDSIAPAPPLGLMVTSTSSELVYLSWESNTEEDLEGYRIYRSKNSNPKNWGKPIDTVKKDTTQYIDTGLEDQTTYYYVITAFDEVPNESDYSNQASGTTLVGVYAPEINNSIKDFKILEDTIDVTTINLYHWFKDRNNDPLEFRCMGGEHIEVIINQKSGEVVLIPENNWNGKETLTFYASDGIANASDEVTITITPVNDPPGPAIIITPHDGQKFEFNTNITFSATCSDLDLKYGDRLTFKWYSDNCGIIVYDNNYTTNKLPTGEHQIILNVTDSNGEYSIDMVHVTVFSIQIPIDNITSNQTKPKEPEPELPEKNNTTNKTEPDKKRQDETISIVTYRIITGIIFIVIILLLLFMFIKKEDIHPWKKLKVKIFRKNET